MNNYTIRLAGPEDAGGLSEIYAFYVNFTAVTFECDPPSSGEIARRILQYSQKYPYLVIEDENGVIGFTFAHAFRERPAYDYAAEVSIYLHPDKRHAGVGRILYTALEHELGRMGVRNLYACIATCDGEDPFLSPDSPRFHAALGYRQCGVFRNCGRKFGHWYHMIFMEKLLCDSPEAPAPLTPYPAVLHDGSSRVREPLSSYNEKIVRLVAKNGELLCGKARYFSPGCGKRPFKSEEDGLQIGAYYCFSSEINRLEAIE